MAAAVASAIKSGTTSAAFSGPCAVFAQPAFIATAVGGVLAAWASIPKFADGGLAYGPTLGLMGEYAGARNNPEVIAPLNKLKDLISPQGNSGDINDFLTADGNTLAVVLNRTDARNSRLG